MSASLDRACDCRIRTAAVTGCDGDGSDWSGPLEGWVMLELRTRRWKWRSVRLQPKHPSSKLLQAACI